jgi:hypothetical protein
MGKAQRDQAESPSLWVRALVVLVALGVLVHGIYCLIHGRLETEGIVLEGVPARLVGASVAVFAAIVLAQTVYPRGKKP